MRPCPLRPQDSEQSDELRDMLPNLVVAQLLEDCVSLGQGVAHVALPGCKGLRAQLAPLHERLAGYAGEYEARALHLISREERDAAEEMLGIIRWVWGGGGGGRWSGRQAAVRGCSWPLLHCGVGCGRVLMHDGPATLSHRALAQAAAQAAPHTMPPQLTTSSPPPSYRRYLDATLAPQQPPEAPASGASSVCSEPLALPSPRSASGLTGRLRSFFGGDEERARFWQSFGQTAMVAQYSI